MDIELSIETLKNKEYKEQAAAVVLAIYHGASKNYAEMNNTINRLHDGKIEYEMAKEKLLTIYKNI